MNSIAIKLRSRLLVASLLLLSATSTLHAADYRLRIGTDRKTAIYETGEDAKFVITVMNGDSSVSTGSVNFVVDDYVSRAKPRFPRGTIKLTGKPVTVTASMKTPGFLRCRVTYVTPEKKRLQATAGAGFSPKKIKPSLPVPDDFDAFWADQKRKLAAVPMTPELTPVKHANPTIACFDVQVKCLGGAPVSGYFAKPKGAKPKSLPIILWVHGAGVRSSSLGNAAAGAQAGMLSMDINAHGIANGQPAAYYKKMNSGPLKNYRHAGRTSRDMIYFRGMYLRLVRAIDFLTAQPEWNGKVVAVIGHSQGGGQALVAGGLDDRVTIIASGVPAICDHSGAVIDRVNGWPKLVPNGKNGKPDAAVLKASRYIDAVNFASRCKAEAIMSVGFIDPVCPPSSCYAAFNSLQGSKRMINEPMMSHAAPQHIRKAFFKRIQEHARKRAGSH